MHITDNISATQYITTLFKNSVLVTSVHFKASHKKKKKSHTFVRYWINIKRTCPTYKTNLLDAVSLQLTAYQWKHFLILCEAHQCYNQTPNSVLFEETTALDIHELDLFPHLLHLVMQSEVCLISDSDLTVTWKLFSNCAVGILLQSTKTALLRAPNKYKEWVVCDGKQSGYVKFRMHIFSYATICFIVDIYKK